MNLSQQELNKALLDNPDLRIEGQPQKCPPEATERVRDRVKAKRGTIPPINEKDWQKTVIEYAHLRGWTAAHFRAAMTGRTYTNKRGEVKNVWVTPVQADGKGFFDWIFVRPPRILFVELKSDKGKLTTEQENWCRLIAICQIANSEIKWGVWRPADWEMVQKILE